VATLEFLAWTNDTTRATALAYQDGVLVKTGALTRRYLGTFYTTSTTATADSDTNRYLFNNNNRVLKTMLVRESTGTWAYNSTAFRQARASTANQLNFIIGYADAVVKADVYSSNSAATGNTAQVGIGLDSTSTNSAYLNPESSASGYTVPVSAVFASVVSVGKHYLAWLEKANSGTFYGLNNSTYYSGMLGYLNC
jgi:hypothetical protein